MTGWIVASALYMLGMVFIQVLLATPIRMTVRQRLEILFWPFYAVLLSYYIVVDTYLDLMDDFAEYKARKNSEK